MNLVFGSPLDLFAIASAAFIVRLIAGDGETTWFEGLLLLALYAILGMAFFLVR
jgi:Ca2+:H+ antiporter